MSEPTQSYRAVRDIAVILLRPKNSPTEDDVRSAVNQAMKAAGTPTDLDLEALTADLRHSFNVFGGSATALDDPREHKDWLPAKRGSISWLFWHRYETWLEQDKKWPPPVVRSLGERTDEVLKRLEDPKREGAWDVRGMVVGSVQSGKTANYTGLICKAVDAGYRIVVVLAGMHKNLRSQTQLRIDEGFLGFDTEKDRLLNPSNKFKGVGLLPAPSVLHVMSLTSSADDGDFKKKIANTITSTLGGIPTVLVVKKEGRILKNLREWLLHLAGSKVIRDVPLLLIDDEADQASINTKARADLPKNQAEDEEDVSTINMRIRQILAAFEKRAYVGYTATPFANIFINPDARGEKLEDDIFPRSFILNVRPPGNYVGPARVFGLEDDPDSGIEGRPALPLLHLLDDAAEIFPIPHRITLVPNGLPPSLKLAIRCFVLVCAARRARGQGAEHNSMLVHVTRFVPVQGIVTNFVKDEFNSLRKRIAFGDGARGSGVRDELRTIWMTEFADRDAALRAAAPDEVGEPISWSQMDAELHEAASKIEVKAINGTAGDVLDYVNHPEGCSVIAVGGDKLSRGLTLEGLSISYFLRTSRMYDTLMQMGRWFGYRPGYLDLCRLFTTGDLRKWYRHIAFAEEELRREFDYMASQRLTPENYGLGVRSHSEGLIVTALNKMCHARTLQLSFAGELKQTAIFATELEIRKRNVAALETFLARQPQPVVHNPREDRVLGWIWEVTAAQLCNEFLADFSIHPNCHTLDRKRVTEFIKRQTQQGELTTWTLALVNNSQAPDSERRDLAGLRVGLNKRSGEISDGIYSVTKANIQSPTHQAFDLARMKPEADVIASTLAKQVRGRRQFEPEEEQLLRDAMGTGETMADVATAISLFRARKAGRPETDTPNGRVIRELRPVSRGLLLVYAISPQHEVPPREPPYLGLAFSFPTSHTAQSITYEANKRLIEELQDDAYDD